MTPNDKNDLDQDFHDEELLDSDDLGQDDLAYDEDGEIYDENWDDDVQNSGQNSKPVKAKKKMPLFNIIVIGAAVLIGGGILFSMMSGNSTSESASAPSQEIVAAPSPDTAPTVDPDSLAGLQNGETVPADSVPSIPHNAPQGFMNDTTQLDQSGAAPSLPEQGPSMTGVAEVTEIPEATPPAGLPVPNSNPNLPNIDQIKKAETPPAEAPVVDPAPVAATSDPELQSKLDQVINRIDSLEQKLAAAPVAESAPANSGEIASLRIAVERLESKVSKLSETPAAVRTSSVPSFDDEEPSKVIVKKTVAKKKKSPPKETTVSSSNWELRSARPGEAMVGKSGQAELKILRVGDSAPGIGQIQSISQMGGRWVVQGTSGSISQ